jgi:lipoate-protein ligase A
MVETWRVLDTGLASAARNVALDRVLLEALDADEITSTLRFVRFAPSALLACRESAEQALELGACASANVAVQRRITGGVTWLVDERQLGWALYLHRRDVGNGGMREIAKRVGHAVATAVSALGVDARFRGPGEIEVEGRTLCWIAHAAEGRAVMLQGLLLVAPDVELAARILSLPVVSSSEAAVAALRKRLVGITEVLGRSVDLELVKRNITEALESEFDVEFREGDLGLTENARYARAFAEADTADWIGVVSTPASDVRRVEAVRPTRAGVLRASARYEPAARAIRQVWFSGEAASSPPRALLDLEAQLRDLPMERLRRTVESFFRSDAVKIPDTGAADIVAVVELATSQSLTA